MKYADCPERFVKEILNQTWWAKQIEFAQAIRDHDRVACKAGHSVGKTHAIGGVVNWFLHTREPAVIVTTAPSTNQVEMQIWKEIRRQGRNAQETLLAGLLPAKPLWRVREDWYAQGFSTDKGERFRGEHGPNMLFVLDEANGVPNFVWEEVENMCTAPGNKIVAIGNPVNPSGPFYEAFTKPQLGWHCMTISCLDHPNVIHGKQIFPGAASRRWVEQRITKFCIPIELEEVEPAKDFQFPRQSGKWFRPSGTFQARVLGEFPDEGPDTLISVARIAYARTREPIQIDETTAVDLGLDVAYQGGDYCVCFARRGPCVMKRWKWQGLDPELAMRRMMGLSKEMIRSGFRIGTIAVDAIGIGAGIASSLIHFKDEGLLDCERVLGIQVSERAVNAEHYENKRCELAMGLAERFRTASIDLTRLGEDADDFEHQAPQITCAPYERTGRYRLESKDKIREKIGCSPDDLDAMALCFVDTADSFASDYAAVMSAA